MPTDAGVVDGGALNVQIFAGGASFFAAHVKRLRAANPNTLLVSAGRGREERRRTVQSVVGIDLDAFTAYLGAHMPLAAPAANRITKL